MKSRKQRVKINTTFSTSTDLTSGVPQGSVLGPLLFNIFLNELFIFLQDINICNYDDETTPFVCDETLESVLEKLEGNSELEVFWFENNYMKINNDKCHLLVSGTKYEHSWAKIGNEKIWKSNEVKLLGVAIDNKFKFDNHIANICFKVNQKISVLSRLANLLFFDRKRILFKAFFESQFKYCPLILMFCSRRVNNRTNKLHERTLKLVYDDYETSFSDLLAIDGSFTLLLEMYKIKYNLSESCLKDLFSVVDGNYNLHSQSDFGVPGINTVFHKANSIRYFGLVISNSLPNDLKNICDFDLFKTTIQRWKPVDCPCRLCKIYLDNFGFITVSS